MRKWMAFFGALIGVSLVLTVLVGCGPKAEHIYAKVCADTETVPVKRAPDDKCDQRSTSQRYRWRYYRAEVWINEVGKNLPVTKYSYDEPTDAETLVRMPEDDGGTAYSIEHKDRKDD